MIVLTQMTLKLGAMKALYILSDGCNFCTLGDSAIFVDSTIWLIALSWDISAGWVMVGLKVGVIDGGDWVFCNLVFKGGSDVASLIADLCKS